VLKGRRGKGMEERGECGGPEGRRDHVGHDRQQGEGVQQRTAAYLDLLLGVPQVDIIHS
jgi:hypothetical protein